MSSPWVACLVVLQFGTKWVNGVARHLRYAAQQVGHANPKFVLVKEVVSRNSAQIWTCKLVSRVQSRQSMRAANVVSKFQVICTPCGNASAKIEDRARRCKQVRVLAQTRKPTSRQSIPVDREWVRRQLLLSCTSARSKTLQHNSAFGLSCAEQTLDRARASARYRGGGLLAAPSQDIWTLGFPYVCWCRGQPAPGCQLRPTLRPTLLCPERAGSQGSGEITHISRAFSPPRSPPRSSRLM